MIIILCGNLSVPFLSFSRCRACLPVSKNSPPVNSGGASVFPFHFNCTFSSVLCALVRGSHRRADLHTDGGQLRVVTLTEVYLQDQTDGLLHVYPPSLEDMLQGWGLCSFFHCWNPKLRTVVTNKYQPTKRYLLLNDSSYQLPASMDCIFLIPFFSGPGMVSAPWQVLSKHLLNCITKNNPPLKKGVRI